MLRSMEKKCTNSGPFISSTCKVRGGIYYQ
jgi:hypothetical protein